MPVFPERFAECVSEIHRSIANVEGWLAPREVDFLALLAAMPTAQGEILELGSYRGKSAIILAKGAALADGSRVTTVDPLAPDLLRTSLQQAGVSDLIDVHQAYSQEFCRTWKRPLRLLWHDGANDYDVVRHDLETLLPWLQDRAIVAFHDVLNPSGERIHVFINHVLESDRFGAAGLCGSIGWAQHFKDPQQTACYTTAKDRLRRKLKKLAAYHWAASRPTGLAKFHYRFLRSRIPHHAVDPLQWIRKVA